MKHLFLLLSITFIAFSNPIFAQPETLKAAGTEAASENQPVRLPDSFAEDQRDFVEHHLKKMIYANLTLTNDVINGFIEDQAVVSFEFDASGKVSNIEMKSELVSSCNEALADAINQLPVMTPAMIGEVPTVSERFQFAILFTSDEAFYESIANSAKDHKRPENEVFLVVEEMPRFPGCEEFSDERVHKKCYMDKMVKFIYGNLMYPIAAKENGIEGTVVIRFIVMEDGSIENAEITRDLGYGMGEEGLRIVESMPSWIPGRQRGNLVKVYFNLPIKFRLE